MQGSQATGKLHISFFAAGHRRLIPRAVDKEKKNAEQQKLDITQLISVSRLCALFTTNPTIMPFAQLVIGPPGAGKSTYCNGMHQFLGAIGRKCSIVNLDPANDKTSYPCALDVRDLVTLEEIMDEDKLGPNGGVLYALEELEKNFDWLEEGLKELGGMSAGSLSTI
jgi:GTPase SAR1 family protein